MEELETIKKVCKNADPECEIVEEKEGGSVTGVKVIFKGKLSLLGLSSRLGLNRVIVTNKPGPIMIMNNNQVISGNTFKKGLIDYYINRKTGRLTGLQYLIGK